MAVHSRQTEITIAALHANTEAIIRDLPESQGVMIISEDGEPVAWLAPVARSDELTPEQVREVLQAYADSESEDPSEWIDHDEFMRELEERSQDVTIVSESGEPVAWLAPIDRSNDLTAEQVREIMQASLAAEHADSSQLIDHEDFMRELEEEERQRESATHSPQ